MVNMFPTRRSSTESSSCGTVSNQERLLIFTAWGAASPLGLTPPFNKLKVVWAGPPGIWHTPSSLGMAVWCGQSWGFSSLLSLARGATCRCRRSRSPPPRCSLWRVLTPAAALRLVAEAARLAYLRSGTGRGRAAVGEKALSTSRLPGQNWPRKA